MKKYIVLFCFLSFNLFAQLDKNVEIEVVGKPTWQMMIPLQEDGLLFLVRSDVTKAMVYKFDKDLNKLWEKEVFLDAEDPPKAYTIADDHISVMFSETSGMYYQVFEFDLSTGEIDQDGFELREFFVDQDYVFLGDKVLMAGSNEKGAAFFNHNFTTEIGQLKEQSEIAGKVSVNLFEYLPESNVIESLWSVKTTGYANEKKKKGEFVKDAFIVHALLDTAGNVLSKTSIKQKAGNFPIDAQLVRIGNGQKLIMGQYQSNSGDKGIYTFDLNGSNQLKTYSFSSLLRGRQALSIEDMKALMSSYHLMSNKPVYGDGKVYFGGSFIKAQFQTVTENDPNYRYDPYGSMYGRSRYNSYYNNQRSRTTTRQVFRGYHYPVGFVLEFTENGDLITSNRIDINNVSYQVEPSLAYNESGAVAYCLKGNLAANNFAIGNKPILYKLSEEQRTNLSPANISAIPSYNGVKYWYDNYFIAEGSRSKVEAVTINDEILKEAQKKKKKGLFGRKKDSTPPSYAQVRKIIYLTKIASGSQI
ncbi:hypothetical protein [Jiulongibacter sp. NS-SX5]|uniref:hypothetical protein n=1 Tax=Jiulongibacter sp. NS-SX5 TaxID=3463854 RepID=UPI004057D8C5